MWGWISVALSGFISISALENHRVKQALLFKNITLALLFTMVAERVSSWSSPAAWIALGLIVAMIADSLHIMSKWPKACFIAFLLSQLCYSKAFWLQLSGTIAWWLPALLLATSIVAFFLLLPQLDTLIFPVAIMGSILVQLAWASGEVWLKSSAWGAFAGFIGSLILILSALLLAIHDYRHSLPWGQYWISGSYLLAQALIVASIL